MSKVKIGDTVKVNYTGKFEDGTVFDSSKFDGRIPLEAKLGEGQLIKGFEQGLLDMEVGETKTIQLEPENAYGQRIDALIHEISKTQVPESVKEGEMLQASGPQGNIMVKVIEVKEETVVLDANHPLAGKNLTFEVELLEIVEG